MQEQPETSAVTPDPSAPGWSWASLMRWSAIAAFVVMALITVFAGLIPPLIVFAILWLVGAVLVGRKSKAAAILILIVSGVFIAMSAPFMIPTLAVPASAGDFILNIASLVAAALAVIASIAVLRRRDGRDTGAPRKAWWVGTAVVVISVVVGLVAMFTYEDATQQDGDVALVTEDIEFSEENLAAESGQVAVFVENKDSTLHTFTIDELNVDLDIPAGSTARVTFDAEPGSYQFYCVPHEGSMEGELEVQ